MFLTRRILFLLSWLEMISTSPTPRESFTMFCLAWYILALGFMVILPPQPSKSWDYKLEPHKLFLRFLLNYVYLYVSVCGYVYVSAGAQRSEEDVKAP